MNDGLTKIRGVGVLATPRTTASITMAANEFEAFQLVVRAPDGLDLTGFLLELPGLKNAANQSLKAVGGRIRIYREHRLDIAAESGMDGATGFWPDPLIPDRDELYNEPRNAFVGDIPRGLWHAYYIEVYLPTGVALGTLSGTLKASWGTRGTGQTFSVPVTVTQNALTLPSTSTLRTFYDTGWANFCAASGGCPSGMEKQQDDFIQYLLDHRLASRLGSPIVNGVRNLSAFIQRHQRFFDGTSGTVPRPDGSRILPGAKVTSFVFEPKWGSDEQSRNSQLYADWRSAFESAGWYYRAPSEGGTVATFDYTCDEPANGNCASGAYIPPRATSVHDATPEFPVLVTNPVSAYSDTGAYCPDAQQPGNPLLTAYGSYIDLAVANSQYVRNGADAAAWTFGVPTCSRVSEVWWYQACDVHGCGDAVNADVIHQPNIMIDVGCAGATCDDAVSGAQNRAMQWFTYYYRFKGELYWDYVAAFARSTDPWTSVWFAGGNGDGTLVYPWTLTMVGGSIPVPVPSLRLKILRDGMEDYEYLVELDKLCSGDARKMVIDLFGVSEPPGTPKKITSTRSANVPVAELYRVRGAIADRIAALKVNPSLCPTSPPPPPPPPAYCPADYPYDCCGDGSACMAVRSKCDVVDCG